MSLAMVEAAVRVRGAGARVLLDDVLGRAHARPVRDERRADVRAVLDSWVGVRAALTAAAPAAA